MLAVLGAAGLAACAGGGRQASRTPTKDSIGQVPSAAAERASPRVARDASSGQASARRDLHTLVFVGTSLTAGLGLDPDSAYPARIQRKIDSAGLPFHVVNAGVSGETSAGALRRIGWVLGQRVDVLVLETGANDGLRGTSVSETRANIQGIIDSVRRLRPEARILLVQMEAPPNMGVRYTREFHETFPLLAERNRIELLPFLLQGVAGHAELNQADGLHPNDRGERLVAGTVWKGLRPVLDSVARGAGPVAARVH